MADDELIPSTLQNHFPFCQDENADVTIWFILLDYLEGDDLLQMKRSCKIFRNIIQDRHLEKFFRIKFYKGTNRKKRYVERNYEGDLHGLYKEWNDRGQLTMRAHFENGLKHGTATKYERFRVVQEVNWYHDLKHGTETHYDGRRVSHVINWNHGLKHGPERMVEKRNRYSRRTGDLIGHYLACHERIWKMDVLDGPEYWINQWPEIDPETMLEHTGKFCYKNYPFYTVNWVNGQKDGYEVFHVPRYKHNTDDDPLVIYECQWQNGQKNGREYNAYRTHYCGNPPLYQLVEQNEYKIMWANGQIRRKYADYRHRPQQRTVHGQNIIITWEDVQYLDDGRIKLCQTDKYKITRKKGKVKYIFKNFPMKTVF